MGLGNNFSPTNKIKYTDVIFPIVEDIIFITIIILSTYVALIIDLYVTVFWKTDLMISNTEIHFSPVDESHTLALSKDTTRWPALLLQTALSNHKSAFMAFVTPEGH